jgi:hypothetical protein
MSWFESKKFFCCKCGIKLPSDIMGRLPSKSYEFNDGLYCDGCAKRRKDNALGGKVKPLEKEPNLLDL